MKTIDYVVGGVGAQRTITARTDRAKSRTPEPIGFNDKASALKFVKAANAEGYRFSGQELLNPDYRLVKYVYFVRRAGGRFEPGGQDWGPPDPVFETGDIYPGGPRDGKEAVVLSAVKGESAKINGGDVMILLEERPVGGTSPPAFAGALQPIPEAVYWEAMRRFAEHQKQEEDRVTRYGQVRPQISLEFQGHRFVIVGGTLYYAKN